MIHAEKKRTLRKKNQILRQKRKGNVSSFQTHTIIQVSVKTMCIGV